jgi:hypothetical protein
MSRRSSELAALAAVGVLAAACASAAPVRVGVEALQADIVFGVDLEPSPPPAERPVAPRAASYGVAPGIAYAVPGGGRFDDVSFLVPAGAPGECPEANIGASPALAAPLNATDPPAEGLYRWQRSGTTTSVVDGTRYTTELSGLEQRVVRDVEHQSATRWTYETVRPQGGFALVERYSVNTAPVERSVNNPTATPVRTGEPNRGLVLLAQELYDANGRLQSSFDPVGGILLLPLGVVPGDSWRSVAVDSRSLASVVFEGMVSKRQAVDACGTMLDGWLVQGTMTRSGDEPVEQLELVVSPELGALIISQHVTSEGPDGSVDALYEIGQRTPDPAPAGGT